jgi:cell division septation protein DedD
MLRMMLLGFLILLGVGVLSAMELRTPPRSAVAIVQPLAEPNADISDSHDALAKADRLEVAAVSTETPEQAVLIDEGTALPEDNSIGSSEPPRPIARHRHNSKSKKVTTAARPKSEPKATVIKRTAISERSKAASDTEPCRLKAFGGLRKALNSADCEI